MTSGSNLEGSGQDQAAKDGEVSDGEQPGWADGLRQLYDSVVSEPLPDNFKDLLAKLDDQG